MRSVDPQKAPNIFEKKNPAFKELHSTIDFIYRKLRSDGVGAEKHSAVLFSKKVENELWEQGVIGKDSPTALLRAVFFFTMAKTFASEVETTHTHILTVL